MRYLFLLGAASAGLFPVAAVAQSASPSTETPATDQAAEIVVTAKKLDEARDAILPSLGASDYHIDRKILENQPGGVDRSLVQVLVQAPGVTLDSYGSIHVRNEHGNLQYRLNGIIVPESIHPTKAGTHKR